MHVHVNVIIVILSCTCSHIVSGTYSLPCILASTDSTLFTFNRFISGGYRIVQIQTCYKHPIFLGVSYLHCCVFTAPEGAPPCEVYNFSITAINDTVGITYAGAGCSQVLSTMIPSPPNISRLEASLSYSLEKRLGKVFLNVSFQVLPSKYMYIV